MLPQKLAFVDIETTGGRYQFDRIIEIGIIRVENNNIIAEYNQLLHPQSHLPPEITLLTGITAADLESQPTFYDVKHTIYELLQDCVFVAHNARFDYSFIKHEFLREDMHFAPKQCCTVKLSRSLFPTEHHHNLDAVMQRLQLVCENRHRAFDDAHVLFQFYKKIQILFPNEVVEHAVAVAMKKPSLPTKLSPEDIDQIPEQPGVYIFYGENNTPLYIGKSKNIRERVLSHFSADIRHGTEMKISQQIERIETKTTAGELGALFTESKLVKQLLPIYNRKLRRQSELTALISKTDTNGYPLAVIETVSNIDPNSLSSFIGFFRSKKQAKDYLSRMVKEYSLCDKLLAIEKTNGACFSYRLGICKGACIGKEPAIKYMLRFVQAFADLKIKPWPFKGAVVIEEYNPINQKKEYFIVDKWCYVGSILYNGDTLSDQLVQNTTFDLDTYKILRGFFRDKKHEKQIKNLKNFDTVQGLVSNLFAVEN